MAYDIGPKIGIDGEAEFRKAISQINTSLKTLGTEMKAVSSAYDSGDKSAEALSAKNEVLAKQIDAQNEKLAKLREGLSACSAKYGEMDEKTQKWQQAVNAATADLNGMERELKDNTSDLEQLGSAAIDAGEKADKAKAGWSNFGEKLSSVATTAAKVVAAVAAAAAGAATAVGKMTLDAAAAADDLNTLSTQTGLSTDQLQKFQYASDLIDVDMDTLTGSLSKLIKNMDTASSGSGDAADAFKALGVSITDSNGELRNNQDVFNDCIDALGHMENATQRDAYAMAIFGKSAQDLNPLILGGADALKQLGDQAEVAGLILSQDDLNSLNALNDQVDIFKATVSSVGKVFAAGFSGPMTEGLSTVNGYITQLASAFSSGGFSALAEELGAVLSDALAKLNEYLPQIMDFGVEILTTLIDGVAKMLPDLAETAVNIVVRIVEGIVSTLPVLIPAAIDMILTLAEAIVDNLDQLIDAALQMIEAIAYGLIDALPKLAEKVPEIITKIITVITENLPQIIQASVEIMIALATGLIQAIPVLVKSIPQIVAAIVNGFSASASSFTDIGKNIVSGIWRGIQAFASWFREKIGSFFSDIVNGVKKTLGIASPSKVFAGIGGYMAEGLGEGFSDSFDNVQRQIAGNLTSLNGKALSGVDSAIRAFGGSGEGSTDSLISELRAIRMAILDGSVLTVDSKVLGQVVSREQSSQYRVSGKAALPV